MRYVTVTVVLLSLLATVWAHKESVPKANKLVSERNIEASSLTTTQCHYYNETNCRNSSGSNCNGTDYCKPINGESKDKAVLCYVLWKKDPKQQDTDDFTVKLKGCWIGNPGDCYETDRCVEKKKDPKNNLLFCCCSGDFCNQDMHHDPVHIEESHHNVPLPSEPFKDPDNSTVQVVLFVSIPIFCFISALFIIWIYRYRKMTDFNELPTNDSLPISESQTPFIGFKPIQLIEVKAQGRFGAVWKARVGYHDGLEQLVAVKIFPPQDKASWAQEHEIYQLPQLRHENILCFMGAERRGNAAVPFNCEYWLITEYHELGSLCDYLKAHTVTYVELLRIAEGIARGLTHLHEEFPARVLSGNERQGLKPSVAHRDFKSKNVLLKPDLTACIADFGLALVFYPNEPANEALGQVGTRRYMAPEVLEGAISFSRDALLRIDMYACGLVLWELVSRCTEQDGEVGNYQLPFEEETGPHPSLEDIQEVVCQAKKRPEIKESWRRHAGLKTICDTIDECWDQDAEARLSASCVEERISTLSATGHIYINYLGRGLSPPASQLLQTTCNRNALNVPLLVKETST